MQDRLPQSRSDAVLQARTGDLSVLRELAPYVWPADRPDLRMRVVFALLALVVAKAITLAVPIAYKAIVDLLTGEASAGEIAGLSALGLAAGPAMLIIAYGVGPRADGAVRAIPRRVVHRGRPACRARARQPHLPASA